MQSYLRDAHSSYSNNSQASHHHRLQASPVCSIETTVGHGVLASSRLGCVVRVWVWRGTRVQQTFSQLSHTCIRIHSVADGRYALTPTMGISPIVLSHIFAAKHFNVSGLLYFSKYDYRSQSLVGIPDYKNVRRTTEKGENFLWVISNPRNNRFVQMSDQRGTCSIHLLNALKAKLS